MNVLQVLCGVLVIFVLASVIHPDAVSCIGTLASLFAVCAMHVVEADNKKSG